MAHRILAFDISMSRPGAAIVEVKNGKAKVVAVSNCRTNGKEDYVARAKHIEAWAYLFIRDNMPRKGFDTVVRESYAGRFNNRSIFTAWSAIDRAQSDLGVEDTTKPIAQQTVKKHVVGKGRAEKAEVEEAVRKLTKYKGEFACDDESDAVAIALCYAIQNELIKEAKE